MTARKIVRPDISIDLAETGELHEGDKLDMTRLTDVDTYQAILINMQWSEVEVKNGTFMQADLDKIQMLDVRVQQTDCTAMVVSDGSFHRVEFEKCRMDGMNAGKALFQDVVFKNCKLNLANFRFSNLRRVRFQDCSLVETDFMGAKLKDVEMIDCTIDKTIFDQVTVASLDISQSTIESLSGWRDLKGATIGSVQLVQVAPQIAHQLGLRIKE